MRCVSGPSCPSRVDLTRGVAGTAVQPTRRRTTIGIPEPNGAAPLPVESKEVRDWPAPLAGRLAGGETADQVADTVVALWLEIDRALSPIIGHRGVAALYNRSLKVTAAIHPWLAVGHHDVMAAVDATGLRSALAQRAADQAAAGGSALFHTFHELLASLVGAELTDQLLGSVWARPAGTRPAQDTPP